MSVSLSLAAALEKRGIKLVPSTTALKKEGGRECVCVWGGCWGETSKGDATGVGT